MFPARKGKLGLANPRGAMSSDQRFQLEKMNVEQSSQINISN